MQKGLVFLAIILGAFSGVFIVTTNLSLLEAVNLTAVLLVSAATFVYLDNYLEKLREEEWKKGVFE